MKIRIDRTVCCVDAAASTQVYLLWKCGKSPGVTVDIDGNIKLKKESKV